MVTMYHTVEKPIALTIGLSHTDSPSIGRTISPDDDERSSHFREVKNLEPIGSKPRASAN